MSSFKRFDFALKNEKNDLKEAPFVVNIERVKNKVELYTYSPESTVKSYLDEHHMVVDHFEEVKMELEDAFIGLTGKY